jgi:glycosyltransferase involved in cell wall biosynthesis
VTMPPRVSVIIPFRDARSQLLPLVEALRGQTCGLEAFEVIWVDDGSRDDGAVWLKGQLLPGWQLLVHALPRGAYAARNTGLSEASAENIAFTDVDCRPYPDWIECGLCALASVPRLAGRVQVALSPAPSAAELVDAGRFFRQRRYVEEGFGATANLFVRRSVFAAAGGFDERLKSGGDYEFGLRCTRAGIPIAYAEHVVVAHAARASVRELLSKSERVGFGTGQLIRRGGIPMRRLAGRVRDRFAIARRRGAPERPLPVSGRSRSFAVSGLHSLVLLATVAGGLRGFLLPGPAATSKDNRPVRLDSL